MFKTLILSGFTFILLNSEVALARVSKMKIVTAPQTVALNQCSKAVKVQSQNRYGTATSVTSDTRLYFDQGSANLRIFRDASCTIGASTVMLRAGTDSVSFYFRGTTLGAQTLYVSTMNFEDDQQVETITTTPPMPTPTATPPPVPTPAPTATPTPPRFGRSVPAPIYGVTLDDVTSYKAQMIALQRIPYVPTARVVLDPDTSPSDYSTAIQNLATVSYIMTELLDSADMKSQTVSSFQSRAQSYFSALKNSVDIWEIGNEINGDWLGAGVEDKLRAGFKVIDDAGGTTAITFFWFGEPGQAGNCIPGSRYEMFTWIKNLLQLDLPVAQRNPENEKLRLNLDYAFISWYPQQCNNIKPDWTSIFNRLAVIFPNAKIGIGEIGTANPQNGSTYEINLINEFYPMAKRLPLPASYVGGYFWWYFAEEYNNSAIMDALINAILMGPAPLK